LSQLLENLITQADKWAMHVVLQTCLKINAGAHQEKDKRGNVLDLVGPTDVPAYFLRKLESGKVLTNRYIGYTEAPVVVQNDAKNIVDIYNQRKNSRYINIPGLPSVRMQPGDFIGVLGYTGDGKSTLCRYILYNLAEAGHNVFHITMETPVEEERNKYIILHAHNPKWNDKYAHISWRKWVEMRFTKQELRDLDAIGKDFHDTMGGKLTIRQAGVSTWPYVKSMIENQDRVTPLACVFLDYVQLMEPGGSGNDNRRTKMGSMVREIRHFGMNYPSASGERLTILTPVQANEQGRSKAAENEGRWSKDAVNDDKELSRSLAYMWGVFDLQLQAELGHVIVFSVPKDRDGIFSNPFRFKLSGAGWISDPGNITAGDVSVMKGIAERERISSGRYVEAL